MSTVEPQQPAPSIWNRPLPLQTDNNMNPNDFQSICQLALSQFTSSDNPAFLPNIIEAPCSKSHQQKPFLKRLPTAPVSAMLKETEDEKINKTSSSSSSSSKLGRFVHFLRCSTCGLESINKTRFDCHLPCCLKTREQRYMLHTCSVCFACSTSKCLMDEHIDLFHCDVPVELINTQETLKCSSELGHSVTPPRAQNCSTSPVKSPSNFSPLFQPTSTTSTTNTIITAANATSRSHCQLSIAEVDEESLITSNMSANLLDMLVNAKKAAENGVGYPTSPTTAGQTEGLDLSNSNPFSSASKTAVDNHPETLLPNPQEFVRFMTAMAASGGRLGNTSSSQQSQPPTVMEIEEVVTPGRKCHICNIDMPESLEELGKHLAFVHLIPIPIVIGQLATLSSSKHDPTSFKGIKSDLIPPPISMLHPMPPINPDSLSRGPWDLSNLLTSNPLMQKNWPKIENLTSSASEITASSHERYSQIVDSIPTTFPFPPFNQQQTMSQHPPTLPLGSSKNLFGLNFDLPLHLTLPTQMEKQTTSESGNNIFSGAPWSDPAISSVELDFKRARLESTAGVDNSYFPRFRPIDSTHLSGRYLSSSSSSSLGAPMQPLYSPFPGEFLHSSLASSISPMNYPKGLPKNGSFSGASSATNPPRGSGSADDDCVKRAGSVASGEQIESSSGGIAAGIGIVHNTLRKTKSDMKVIHRYFVQVKNDTRDIHEIPPEDLCKHIQDFIVTAKKKDGHEYEPESLKAFVHSLERHLKYHNYPHSVLKDPVFASARMVLSQRLNELRVLSQANGSSAVHRGGQTECKNDFQLTESIPNFGNQFTNSNGKLVRPELLVQNGLLGLSNPQALLNSIWLIVRTQFNIVGTQKHKNLTWGQFQFVTNANNQDLLRFTSRSSPTPDVRYCHGHGGPLTGRVFDQTNEPLSGSSQKRQCLPFDCVEIFNYFTRLRPIDCRGSEDPLYLSPDPSWEKGGAWFKSIGAGTQILSRIPRILGMKPTREQILNFPIEDGGNPFRQPFGAAPEDLSKSFRDNLLASMNSLLAEKFQKPVSNFLSQNAAFSAENLSQLSMLAAAMPQFSDTNSSSPKLFTPHSTMEGLQLTQLQKYENLSPPLPANDSHLASSSLTPQEDMKPWSPSSFDSSTGNLSSSPKSLPVRETSSLLDMEGLKRQSMTP